MISRTYCNRCEEGFISLLSQNTFFSGYFGQKWTLGPGVVEQCKY